MPTVDAKKMSDELEIKLLSALRQEGLGCWREERAHLGERIHEARTERPRARPHIDELHA